MCPRARIRDLARVSFGARFPIVAEAPEQARRPLSDPTHLSTGRPRPSVEKRQRPAMILSTTHTAACPEGTRAGPSKTGPAGGLVPIGSRSGKPRPQPPEHRADQRLLLPVPREDQPANGADPIPGAAGRRRPLLVRPCPRALVQEVRTAQTHGDLGVIAQVDDVLGRTGLTAAPAPELATGFVLRCHENRRPVSGARDRASRRLSVGAHRRGERSVDPDAAGDVGQGRPVRSFLHAAGEEPPP